MLWPRIVVEQSGYNLAASGAVGRNAYDDEEVALALLEALHRDYPGQVEQRYRLDVAVARTDDERLAAIGRQRGAVLPGGRISLQKAAEIVLHDFRSGSLGRITLETPQNWLRWQAEAVVKEAERSTQREAKKKAGSRSRVPSEAPTSAEGQ
jgi:ribosome biogenesis GTPase A